MGAESAKGDGEEMGHRDLYVHWLFLSGLVCFGFAAVVSLVIALKLWSMEFFEEGLVLRLMIKGVFFSALTAGCGWMIHRLRNRIVHVDSDTHRDEKVSRVLPGVIVLLISATIFPMLHEYPWTAPDELHHLVVARNLAEHSAYASGNPEAGFNYFNHLDSVGPSVLGPVALAFKAFSTSIPAARAVMGLFYLGLALGVFVLVRNAWGASAAIISVGATTLSFGTIYLSRSLYGEVPALMFLVWSLVCWGKSLESERGSILVFASGALWGLGILAKSFLFLSAFPVIGVLIYDRLTTKQIAFKSIALPAAGAVVVLGIWYSTVAYFSYLKTEDISTLFLYRHYLMFGIPSSWEGVQWFTSQPIYTLSLLAIAAFTVPQLFAHATSPTLRVLLLTSELYVFWWIFYTPASIPRYMWYSCAILAFFSGPLVIRGIAVMRDTVASLQLRAGYLIAVSALLIPCGYRLYEQGDLIYVQDQAADERHLAPFIQDLPEDAVIATAYWPAALSVDFMTGRNIAGIEDLSEIDDKYDVIIYNTNFNAIEAEVLERAHRIGRYAIVRPD